MPIEGSDYAHRSEDLQKLAKLAGKVDTGQDSRIIVSNGGFVQGSTTAWRRAPSNQAAQIEFKKILNKNYGMDVADRVAKDLGLRELWEQGKHLSALHIASALERAEGYASESDDRYWEPYLGMASDSPRFNKALEFWVKEKIEASGSIPAPLKKGVLKAVLESSDIKLMLKMGGELTPDSLAELADVVLDELERITLIESNNYIHRFFGEPLGSEKIQRTLMHWLCGQFDVSTAAARAVIQCAELQLAINNGDGLTEDHLELLMSKIDKLNILLSPSFVDQSDSKVKSFGLVDKQEEIVLDSYEQSGRQYSQETQEAIESGNAYGLVAYDRPEYQIDKSGICYDSQGIQRIGDKYVYVQNKRKGVEPGFEARKAFLAKDFEKVFHQPDHKYYKAADTFLRKEMDRKGSPIYSFCLKGRLTGEISDNWSEAQVLSLLREVFATEIIEHITATFPKFQKIHFVKLDYKESDMNADLVRIPKEKSKGVLHRNFTAQTRKEANESAAQEAIANDLLRMLGVYSQKLKIISSQYSDGTPKLLLDGTFMKGPNGENFSDFSGCIVDGYLVSSEDAKMHKEGKLQPGQRIKTDQSVEDLGKFLIFMLGLADRDALGSRGDNKGRCGNTFAGIDPGHSLEVGQDSLMATNLMTFENVHSDFSFDQPGKIGDKLSKGYKNFDVFQDRPYLEKMKGIESWIALRDSGEDVALFDAYLEAFDGTGKDNEYHSELDFREKIEAMKEAYIARRDYILDQVFGDRAPFLAEDSKPYGKPALEMVDALEKLTSVTSMVSPSGVVGLEHPRVVSRVQWDMAEDNNHVVFTTKAGVLAANKLKEFGLREPLPCGAELKSGPGGVLHLVVPKDQMIAFSEQLNETAVVQYKHPRSWVEKGNGISK